MPVAPYSAAVYGGMPTAHCPLECSSVPLDSHSLVWLCTKGLALLSAHYSAVVY